MQGLTFDEATHTYRHDGRVIPGVTNTIKSAGMMDFHGDATEARERGRAVHMICELWDTSTLNTERVSDDLRGYLDAWIKFRTEANVSHIEWCGDELASKTFTFAGRIDRLVSFRESPLEYILDIKSGQQASWHRIQTAAYELLRGVKNPIRYCVYLRKDGTFKLVEHDKYSEDIAVFNAAMVILQWKANAK